MSRIVRRVLAMPSTGNIHKTLLDSCNRIHTAAVIDTTIPRPSTDTVTPGNNPVDFTDPSGLTCMLWLHLEYVVLPSGRVEVDWANTYTYRVCTLFRSLSELDPAGELQKQREELERILKQGIEDAERILENASDECKALF